MKTDLQKAGVERVKVWLDASSFENEILSEPTAESVELLSLAGQRLDEVVRLLLHVHQAQVVENKRNLVLNLGKVNNGLNYFVLYKPVVIDASPS
jgi:hypothetical protein